MREFYDFKIFHGDNCHADIVLNKNNPTKEDIDTAKLIFVERGFKVVDEAILGNFAIKGTDFNNGHDAKLTEMELDQLGVLGEINPQDALV